MPTPLDQYLNPDGTLNLAAIYSRPEATAADAALAAQGHGQYRDYGNITGPTAGYTTEGDPGSTPAYWGGSPYGVGGQVAYDPAAHGGATNPYAASLLAQLGSGGAGGAAAGWTPGGGQGGMQGGPAGSGGAAGGAALGFTPTAPLGPEYYDPNQAPTVNFAPGQGPEGSSTWKWADGRWQIVPADPATPNNGPYANTTPAATPALATGGPGQPPTVYAEQGPGEAGIYPGGSGPVASVAGGVHTGVSTATTPALSGAALVNAPAGYTSTWTNPAGGPGVPSTPAAVIRRLTGSKIAAPVGQSTQSSGLINWR